MIQPFFKPSRNRWFLQIDRRRQINLGPDRDAAFSEFYKIMAGERPVTSKTTARELIDQFLVWTKENRAERTFDWYLQHLQSFVDYIGPRLLVHDIKANHVTRWLARSYKTSNSTTQNGACRAVARAFNWSAKQGLIVGSPVKGMEKPAYQPSEACLTGEQWSQLVGLLKPNDSLLDIIWFMHETGCRPHEGRIVAAKDWDRTNRRFVLRRVDSKGKQARRVIRLNDRATAIVTRLALKHPEGALFRTRTGNPWSRHTLRSRFHDLGEKMGIRVFPYILRHTWATEALLRGVDPLTVALLLGHSDANMVMKVYSHLVQKDDFLAAQLKRATGEAG